MVAYIKSDLEFILTQIKIAEAHAAGLPLYGPGADGVQGDNPATAADESLDDGLVPTYNLAWGLRTVDGSYNHLLPGQEQWGAAGNQFPELVDATFDPAENVPPGFGPSSGSPTSYNPSNNPGSMVFEFNAPHDLQPAGRPNAGKSRGDPDRAGSRWIRKLAG